MFNVRKSLIVFISIFVLAAVLSACSGKGENSSSSSADSNSQTAPSTTTGAERTVKDSMGHDVTIPANPQRIIASYLEDYLTVLGIKPAAQWSIGDTVQDYLQPELKDVPKISWDLPPEAVASFNPDLIIVGSPAQVQNGLYDKYSKIAPTYVLGDELSKDWRAQLLKIADLTGKTDVAKKALEDYDKKVADAKQKVHQAIGDQTAAIIWVINKQLYLYEEDRFSGKVLYGDLGIKAPKLVASLPKSSATWDPITLEKLSELDADHIFLVKKSGLGEGKEFLDSPIWKGIPAVKQGHVYEVEDSGYWTNNGLIASEKTIDDVLKALVK
ncbi:iron-hydroxamate ABC transporter substrate-binding protein [Paenibacillus sediminis]|uniref:Iron complex transport system substrate-binding protein n=1 Tax=Paenibacillus sediminis TaxID=664909 RepID=A0ABS4H336_9BACL|nr:iron-hydroxamate ABC transporter substrate-binding protein [Paenibacillus sediminis]MBP1936535.1 iron complex transport system substrate-binding protein [Paenibacillus sediminis]